MRKRPTRCQARSGRWRAAALAGLALAALVGQGERAAGQQKPAVRGSVPEGLNFANGLFRARRFDLAAEEYRKYLETEPPAPYRAEALYGLANAEHFLQEYAQARRSFEAFLQAAPAEHPNVPTALFRVGELAYVTGDLEAARRALEAYTADYPGHKYQELAWPYLGDVRFRVGDLEGARAAYERALKDAPDGQFSDRARLYLGRVLARQGEAEAARARFAELTKTPGAAGRDEALYQIGRLQIRAGNPAEAVEAFGTLEREIPQSDFVTRARLGRAEAMASLGQVDEAEALLEPLREDPAPEIAARASYTLGLARLGKGEAAEALAIFDEAIGKYPETATGPALLFRSAEAADRNGDRDDAIDRFERVADSYPADPWADDALVQAAALALKAGQPDRAAALADRVAEAGEPDEPLTAAALLIVARADLEAQRADEAIRRLDDLLSRHRPDPETAQAARYYLGLAYRAAGKAEEADRVLDELAKAPDATYAADALYLVGQGHFDAGRYQDAIESLNRYLVARPDGDAAAPALARIALSEAALGRDEEADAALGRLAEQFPESDVLAPTRLRLADQALADEDWSRAESMARVVAEADGTDAVTKVKALADLGWALMGSDRPEEAADAFGQVVELAPDRPIAAEAGYVRGRALQEVGETDAALDAYAKVVADHPDAADAPRAELARARLLAETGRPGEAAPLFRSYLDRELGDGGELADRVLTELGWALLDAGQTEEADAAFARLLEDHPDAPGAGDARLNLAESAYAAGRYDEVVDLLGPLVDPASEASDRLRQAALYRVGRTEVERTDWDAAADAFDRLRDGFPDGLFAREAAYWSAEVAFRRGDMEAAEAGFASFVEGAPDDATTRTARLRRVQALMGLGRWSEVLAQADALKADAPDLPQMAEVDFARGRALQSIAPPRFDEARAAYDAVIEARKGGELAAQAQFMKGETFYHQKDYDEAVRAFLRVDILYDAPRWQAVSLLEAGKAYEELDRWADAAEMYERLLGSDYREEPASEEAARRLAIAKRRVSDGEGPGRRG